MGRLLRWGLYGLGAVVGLIVIAVAAIYGLSEFNFRKTYDFQVQAAEVSPEVATVERGEHLARSVLLCVECHEMDFGGGSIIDDPVVARIYAPNLTSGEGGVASDYTDDELARVLRYGISNDGRGLMIMGNRYLTEEDAYSIIAYLRTVPPVDRTHPDNSFGPVGRFGYLVGMFGELIHAEGLEGESDWPEPVEHGVTVEYGEYLANVAQCTECHGANLKGGKLVGGPDDPPAADLTASGHTRDWTVEDFISTIRTGVNPAGHETDPFMASEFFAGMTDDELQAIWLFIRDQTGQE